MNTSWYRPFLILVQDSVRVPVLRSDPSGSYFITDLINELKSILQAAVQSAKNETDLRNLPYHGEPGSSRTLNNPDGTPKQKRWYGPDGTPERDRDYNHDGDMEFPHDHDWEGGKRSKEHLPPSPDYEFSTDPPIRIWIYDVHVQTPSKAKYQQATTGRVSVDTAFLDAGVCTVLVVAFAIGGGGIRNFAYPELRAT